MAWGRNFWLLARGLAARHARERLVYGRFSTYVFLINSYYFLNSCLFSLLVCLCISYFIAFLILRYQRSEIVTPRYLDSSLPKILDSYLRYLDTS